MTTQVTKTISITSGNKIIHNGKVWKIITEVNEYGREKRISEKRIKELESKGLIEKVKIDYNYASPQKHTHKYIVL